MRISREYSSRERKPSVKLIASSPDAEKIVAMASRLCYSPSSTDELEKGMTEKDIKRRVSNMLRWGHLSTLEHACFTFAVEGISRACSHQLVRHRIASYSQQSQRYVKSGRLFNYVVPPGVRGKAGALEEFRKMMDELGEAYEKLINMGVNAEDARYLLPNAAETKLIFSMNARSLLNFFELRLCLRAQAEIRMLAHRMLVELKKKCPIIFSGAGPFCKIHGYCRQEEKDCPNFPGTQKKK